MDYLNNTNKLIKNYMLTFILNALVFISALSVGINTSGLLLLSILTAVVSIIAEDGSFLEFFVSDSEFGKRKK